MLAAFDRALIRVNRWAVIALLAAMAAMVFANVALRFLTDQSILWVEEVSRYLMIWLTFLGSGIVLRYGAHVAIETLAQSLPGAAAAIRSAVLAVLFAFFATMVWLGRALRDAHLGPDDAGARHSDRRRLSGDADRLRADDRRTSR